MTTARSTRWLAVAATMAATLTATAHAGAPRPRYTRDPATIVVPTAPPAARPLDAPLPPPKPTVGPEDILKIQGKVGKLRTQQIDILDGLIEDCAATGARCSDDDLADLHFRKAELYALEQRYYRLEGLRLSIAADHATSAAQKTRFQRQSAANAAEAKTSLVHAVLVYKALADDDRFKNYVNMPKALFYYGFMLGAGGYPTEMREVFDRLLREYPKSEFAPEAHLAFADYHFENNQLADAESRYRRVLMFPKSSVYWYAKYKLGWVLLDQARHQDALEAFHEVAMATRTDPDRALLHRAAINDLVRAYAEVGNVRRAHDYFAKLDAANATGLYERLADILRGDGKTEKAIYVYRDLIGIAPASPNVCVWQHNIAESMLTAGSNNDKLDEIDKLAQLYAVLAKRNTLPATELGECKELASGMAGDMSRAWHSEWAKTQDVNTFALADRAYGIYLRTFAGEPDFAATQYYHAELLWSRADRELKDQRLATQLWDSAAAAFIEVVETGKVDNKLLEESARAVVLATVNAGAVDPRPQPVTELSEPGAAIPKPQPLSERDTKVLAAFDMYIANVRDKSSAELTEMKFYKANLLRRHDHLDDAIPILKEIVAHHRTSTVAQDAVDFLLDSYNRLGREADLVALARDVLADDKFLADKDDLKKRLAAIEVTFARKHAERLEAAGRKTGDPAKLIACGQAYTELYNRDTEAAGADELLYDAAVCFEDGKSVGVAIDMYEKLEAMGDAARKDIRALAVARLGSAYSRIAYYDRASKYLELYYAKYAGVKGRPGLKDSKAAISDAVIYRKGMGDDALAVKDTLLFVANRDATRAEKAEAFFNLYAIYDKLGDTDKLVGHLREYVSRHGAAGGVDRLVQAHARIGLALWNASCPVKAVDGSCIKVVRDRTPDERRTGRRTHVARTRCGSGSKVTVIARDPKKVKDAMAELARAIAEYDKVKGKTGGDEKVATYWYAQAKLYSVEPGYEAYLDRAFPVNLDFDPRHAAAAKRSLARFDAWLADKDAAGKALKLAYQEVIATHDAPNAIAAAARIGEVAQNASDALATAEVPAALRPYEDAVDQYCDTLGTKTKALDDLTIDAYTTCLDTSTKLGWFSDFSRICERELGQLQPGRYPMTAERRGTPTRSPVITDLEPMVTKLQ